MKKNVKKKRDLDRFAALNPRLNAKTRYEVLDMDYLKKLSEDELVFMNQFMAEYVSGAFKKEEDGEYSEENFHKTPEERRECYTRNNVRNRCAMTVASATGNLIKVDDIGSLIDELTDVDAMVQHEHDFFEVLHDDYDNDLSKLNKEITEEMIEDYERVTNPKNKSDRKLAESSYGQTLIELFKDIKLNQK
jgi:hypothetical protein